MKTKIICPSCKEVIDADDDLYSLYCPICSKQFRYEKGKNLFEKKYSSLTKKGYRELFRVFDYKGSFRDYYKAFLMDTRSYKTLLGTLISGIKSSTIRQSNIHFCVDLLSNNFDIIYVNKDNCGEISSSFFIMNSDLDYYLSILKERLSYDNNFFEEEGLKLYLTAVKEVAAFKELYLKLLEKFNFDIPLDFFNKSTDIQNDLIKLKSLIDTKYSINPTKNNPHLLSTKENSDTGVLDLVFQNMNKIYRKHVSYIALMGISLLLSASGVVLIFLLPHRLLIGVPIASLFFALFLIFFFLFSKLHKQYSLKSNIKIHL
jgi:predicted RNA-binding Zn-ribbon protein involved in translation (DUF1610 family)